MNNFWFYFKSQKRGLAEIELDSYEKSILFSPSEFQETRFQKLIILPTTSQTQKTFLEKNVVGESMIVKNVLRKIFPPFELLTRRKW
ncbi:hypothetical protein GvMRE_IIg391 [endosymbiont GvMRE of Glomus versiforme]|nr:hypothetical protein GvMRE_IIg391 [endosymbiont GvMRE of Glomus versiforme]